MASKTSIEWCDATWNPVRGCSRISRGCGDGTGGGCYAEQIAGRFSKLGMPFKGFAHRYGVMSHNILTDETKDLGTRIRWTGRVELIPSALDQPLRWRKPRRISVNSMSDLFHERLSNEDIAAVFGVMAACPQHTFLTLTKRAQRMREWFAGEWIPRGASFREGCHHFASKHIPAEKLGHPWKLENPVPNVHLGVSVEDQATADARIPDLLRCPSAVRWVSYEPALEGVDFERILLQKSTHLGPDITMRALEGWCGGFDRPNPTRLDWLVVGAESGPGARPCDVAWIRSAIAQCRATGTKCFVKQAGANPVGTLARFRDRKGGDPSEWDEDLRVRELS